MSNQDLKVLCVDDEPAILELYEVAVRNAGLTAILVSRPAEALTRFQAEINSIVLVICDFRMPGMTGFELRKAMLPAGAVVPFAIVSSFISREMALEALELKISAFYDKPMSEAEITGLIAKESTPRIQFLRECMALEGVFVEEANAILDDMEPVLLSLDSDRSNQDALNVVFRGAHTLKGSSGCLDSDIITKYVHKYEDIISALRKGSIVLTDEVYETLLKGLDRIKELVACVATKELGKYHLENLLPEVTLGSVAAASSGGGGSPAARAAALTNPTPAKSPPLDPQKGKAKDTISVPVNMLDELSGYSGEITVIRNMVKKIVRALEVKYIGNKDIQSLGELLDEMHKINSTIQSRIIDLRKVPLSGVFKPIPRIVRDLGRDLGKLYKLSIEGETLRVDSSLAAVCSNSLVHLVRNSADHGIEMPKDRAAAGKPETGSIAIACVEEHEEVHIRIRDDGKGIDHRIIRAKALEKGLFTEAQLAAMSEKQILSIIFASGFSTAAKVTDVSGRGVGMDMVRSSVEAVGGHIDIDSTPGRGSTFTLHLPIPKSVLIINSLLVESAGRCFAVPQDTIQRVLRLDQAQLRSMVQNAASGTVLRSNNHLYPLVDLKVVLGIAAPRSIAEKATAEHEAAVTEILILNDGPLHFALRVDGILDSEEIVVKRLQACFNPQGIYAGATFMGDGTIGLILDVGGLATLAGIKVASIGPVADAGEETAVNGPVADSAHWRDYLLFNLGSTTVYGAPLSQVFRLEEIDAAKIQHSGAKRVVIYRDRVMPIYSVQQLLKLTGARAQGAAGLSTADGHTGRIPVIVAEAANGYIGLEVSKVVDIASTDQDVATGIRDRIGITGNTFVRDVTVTVLDLPTVMQHSLEKTA